MAISSEIRIAAAANWNCLSHYTLIAAVPVADVQVAAVSVPAVPVAAVSVAATRR